MSEPLPRYGFLDLAAQTGVCAGEAHSRTPEFETWDLRGLSNGARCCALLRRLPAWLDRWKFLKVGIEEPLVPHASNKKGVTAATNLQLNGYVFVAQGVCHSRGVETVLLPRQKVLMHFVGQARFTEDNGGKKACLSRAEQMRWRCENWDEADAGAGWDYLCAEEQKAAFLARASQRPVQRRR